MKIILDSHLILEKPIERNVLEFFKKEHTFTNPQWTDTVKRGGSTWGVKKFIQAYFEDNQYLILPRGRYRYILNYIKRNNINYKLEDKRREVPVDKKLVFTGKLRNYQKEAIEKYIKHSFGIIQAPCGSGKTIAGMKIIELRQQNTLIIVHTKELMNQWLERLEQFMSFPKEYTGIIGDGQKTINLITIGMVQTLINIPAEEIKNLFGFIIFEEIHHVACTTFTQVISKFDCKYMLGLSATPYRKDGLDKLIHYNIGNVVAEITDKDLIKAGVKITPVVITKDTNFRYDYKDSFDWVHMISELAKDEDRNNLIAGDIAYEAKNGNFCLILSERKKQIEILSYMLEQLGIKYSILTGSTKRNERKEILTDLKTPVLFATKQIAGEGLDIPKLNRLFITTPVKWKGSLKQFIGRILRVCDGKEDAKIYDYVDKNIIALKGMYYSRFKAVYKEFL